MAFLCTNDAIVQAVPCLMDPCVSEKLRTALRIWALSAAVTEGGGDPAEAVAESEVSNSQVMNAKFMSAALTRLYLQVASDMGATVPTDIDELAALVPCYECDHHGLATELALLCQLFNILIAGRIE